MNLSEREDMRIEPSILQKELIGLYAKVVSSSHQNYVGIEGRVLNETRHTLEILHKKDKKMIVKDVAIFHFNLPDGTIVEIEGKAIHGRPENRIKRQVRKWW
jgi:ribonuclease P protein subunit POP4